MRSAFIRRLFELARLNPRIMLITGDLGFGVLDDFEKQFPAQYLNAGVAEQNMTAIATGLALEGFTVFTYSIGNFPTLRCLEQLRNDTFYHAANVKVVSVGGGFSYGQLGMSHHATEDLSILRALPGTEVCAPGSAYETAHVVDALAERPGPAYLRLERAAPDYQDDPSIPFEYGRARRLRNGNDLTFIATGGIVAEAVAAADAMRACGVEIRVISMHCLKPLDSAVVLAAAEETGGIIAIEENTTLGGLGGALAEICLEHSIRPKIFKRLGINDSYTSTVGDQAYLRALIGIDRRGIERAARALLHI